MAQGEDAALEKLEQQSVNSPGLDLLLRRQSLMTRNWPGIALDPANVIRLINPEGQRAPLFWIFNGVFELPALIKELDPDQPIVGMRSLNEVIDTQTLYRSTAMDDLAGYYAEHLLAHFGLVPSIVGANCQAAEIAYRVALRLLDAGAPVRRFVALDAQINVPLPLPVRVIFGKGSHLNPCNDEGAAPYEPETDLRKRLFPCRDFVETDGRHGEYFQPQNIRTLARWILADQPLMTGVKERPGIGWDVLAQDRNEIVLAAPVSAAPYPGDKLGVVPLLRYENETLQVRRHGPHLIGQPVAKGDRMHVILKLPERQGRLFVKPILCLDGHGPLTWPLSRQPDMVFQV